MTAHRVRFALAVGIVALLATGCAAVPTPAVTMNRPTKPGSAASPTNPGSTASPTNPGSAASPTITLPATEPIVGESCVDGVSRISGSAQPVSFSGTCERVEVSGNDLEIDLDAATVTNVIIRGDRNNIDANAVSTLDLQGVDNAWQGRSLGSIALRGDRNEIAVEGDAGAITVSGNDNAVHAASFGAIDDSGARNRFDPR